MKIISIGEALIDLFTENNVSERNIIYQGKVGGAPANVAVAIAKMGMPSGFLGAVGKDFFGGMIIERLQDYGVDTSAVQEVADQPTSIAFVHNIWDGDSEYVFYRGADACFSLTENVFEAMEACSLIHFGSAMALAGGELEDIYFQMLDWAAAHDKIISFDPNFRDVLIKEESMPGWKEKAEYFIKKSHIIKVGSYNLQQITGQGLEASLRMLQKLAPAGAVVSVTRGDAGVLVARDGEHYDVPALPIHVLDTTGAGDAYVGAFLSCYVSEEGTPDILKCAQYGNIAGALACTAYGAMEALPDKVQLERFLKFGHM